MCIFSMWTPIKTGSQLLRGLDTRRSRRFLCTFSSDQSDIVQLHVCSSSGSGSTSSKKQHCCPAFIPMYDLCSPDDKRHGEITFVCLPSLVTWHPCIQQVNHCVHRCTRVLRGPTKKKKCGTCVQASESSNHHCPHNVQV